MPYNNLDILPKDVDLYTFLGIKKNATIREINGAVRRMGVKDHPDKNPETSKEAIHPILLAKDILSDEWSRRIYDVGGLKALKDGKLGEEYAKDYLFETLVDRNDKERCGDVCIQITISLAELYTNDKEVTYWATRECSKCSPLYTKSNFIDCPICKGRGFVGSSDPASPKEVIEDSCSHCIGLGFVINTSCEKCNGTAVYREEIHKNIAYDKLKDDRIILGGDGHHHPGKLPGDLCVFVELLPDARFSKYDNDIVTYMDISILEALIGVNRKFTHIDESSFIITTEGSVEDGDHKEYSGLGFRFRDGDMLRGDTQRGNLIIIFRVYINIELIENAEAMNVLRSCLPGPPCIEIPQPAKKIRIEAAAKS